MGKIVRQGVEYGGSSNSADCIKYNDTKSVKEAIDEIKASSSSNPTASSVTFNNTDTGLNATNVQDAVTEVNDNLNCFIGKKISLERACSAGQWVNKSVGTIPTKDGYSFIGCYVCTGNSVGVSVSYENDSNEVWIYGKTSGTAIVYCYPIYVKN